MLVSYEELKSWCPFQSDIYETVVRKLLSKGFGIDREATTLWISTDHGRFFGSLATNRPISAGASLAIGISSSTDQSWPLELFLGFWFHESRAFSWFARMAKRKRTEKGWEYFAQDINSVTDKLDILKRDLEKRFTKMERERRIGRPRYSAIMLNCYELGLINSDELFKSTKIWNIFDNELTKEQEICRDNKIFIIGAIAKAKTMERFSNPRQHAYKSVQINDIIFSG